MATEPAPTFAHCLPTVVALAREAGAAVMASYASTFNVRGKADASPVADADAAACRPKV